MTILQRSATALCTLCVLGVALPPAAGADEPAAGDADARHLVVVGDDGETLTVDLEGGELTIVTEGADGTTVRVVDMEQVGLLVKDSLQEAFAALRDMQLDVHMGQDNHLDFSHGDETIELDVDAILAGVQAALHEGLGDLDTASWSGVRARDRDEQELRAELRALKREVRRLQKELEKEGI